MGIQLSITDNATSMISVRKNKKEIFVRMHWIFLNADNEILEEISRFIKTARGRTPLVNQFVRNNTHSIKRRPKKKPNLRSKGRYHDLKEIYEELNRKYFEKNLTAHIGWGRKSPRSSKRRTIGSYSKETNTILINPVLDGRDVPKYYIKFVVYHEMLHCDIGENFANKRRTLHPKEFRKRERMFDQYEKAVSWEKRR
jgi:predicted metal-dependent hydrolase